MSKPWEDSDFYREDRYEGRREGRWEGKREGRWGDRDDNFGNRRQDYDRDYGSDRGFGADRGFGNKKPRFGGRRGFDGQRKEYGSHTGPRARAQFKKQRRIVDVDAQGRTVITLDEDVARVFETSASVNAALRKVIELAQVLGPVKGAKKPEWLEDIKTKENSVNQESAPKAEDEEGHERGYVVNSIDPSFDENDQADIAMAEAPQDDEIGLEEAQAPVEEKTDDKEEK